MSIAISISNSVRGSLVPGGGVTPFVNEYSMTFDGSLDYLNGASTFSDLNGGNQITISMWVKPTTGGLSLIYLMSNPRNTTSNQGQFGFYLYKGSRIEFWMGASTTNYIRGDINAITLDAWNHIAVYLDTTQASLNDRGFIYVNGVDVTTSKSLTLNYSMLTATGSLHIGEEQNGGYNPFYGSIDEVSIWSTNQVTNASDIYNGGVPFDLSTLGTPPDHWWRMGDGDTWDGSKWTLNDNIGSYNLDSVSMPEEARLPITPNSYSQNSFVFDGLSDFVNLGNDASRKVQTLTMSVWVKPTAFASDPILLNGHPSYGNQGIEIFWNFNLFRVRINGTGYGLGAGSGQNNWTHIVISYDGNTLKRMVNGVQGADVVVGATINYTNYNGLKLGRSVYGYALGLIDEVAFWDSDQSANFSTIYGNGVPTDILSLSPLNYYRMGESATWDGANWTFVDQGSGGNDGTSSTLPESAKTGDQPYVL